MTAAQKEYKEYLERLSRNNNKKPEEYHKEKATQEVGKEYGLGLEEMEEVAREIWNV